MSKLDYPAAFLVALGKLLEHSHAGAAKEAEAADRGRITDELEAALTALLRQNTFPSFTFRQGDVEYEGEILEELRAWPWSLRLPEGGVERLDITPGTTREDLEGFVEEVQARLFLREGGASAQEVHGQSGIRFGELDIGGEGAAAAEAIAMPALEFDLIAEAEAVGWLNGKVLEQGVVPAREASAVVHLLSVAMHSESTVVVPLVQLKAVDQYTTTHSINVSCLSMALAEHLRFASADVKAIGEAALLHDVGKMQIPTEVLNKDGKLTDEEWKLIQSHTVEGARILLDSGPGMELAAVVAYEHHCRFDGGGYPEFAIARPLHEVSRLVQVCDVYDALRTTRPFRSAWPADRAVRFVEERAGTHLDPQFARPFLSMIRTWEPRHVDLAEEEDAAAA